MLSERVGSATTFFRSVNLMYQPRSAFSGQFAPVLSVVVSLQLVKLSAVIASLT